MLFFISFEESFLIVIVFLLLFGPNKMPEILRDINNLIIKSKNFIKEISNNIWNNVEDIKNPIEDLKNDILNDKNTFKSIKRNK